MLHYVPSSVLRTRRPLARPSTFRPEESEASFRHDAGESRDGFFDDSAYNVNHIHNSILCMAGVQDERGEPRLTHGLRGFADDEVISEIFG